MTAEIAPNTPTPIGAVTGFTDKMIPIAEAIRKEKGLWFILAVGNESGVIALDEALDLSEELVKRLDGAK